MIVAMKMTMLAMMQAARGYIICAVAFIVVGSVCALKFGVVSFHAAAVCKFI